MLLKVLSYPRTLFGILAIAPVTLLIGGVGVLFSPFMPHPWWGTFLTRSWCHAIACLFGIRVKVENPERLLKDGKVMLFNHTSQFDIVAIHVAFRQHIRFGAKQELFQIPVFGAAIKAFGVLPIARGDREKVMKLYDESIARLRRGESFILAPEGTRRDGRDIYEFKSGPFYFAKNAGVFIQPVLIRGAHLALPKGSYLPNWGRWSTLIRVCVLDPIDPKQFQEVSELKNATYELMRREFLANA